jgi:hypothetical protein
VVPVILSEEERVGVSEGTVQTGYLLYTNSELPLQVVETGIEVDDAMDRDHKDGRETEACGEVEFRFVHDQ